MQLHVQIPENEYFNLAGLIVILDAFHKGKQLQYLHNNVQAV